MSNAHSTLIYLESALKYTHIPIHKWFPLQVALGYFGAFRWRLDSQMLKIKRQIFATCVCMWVRVSVLARVFSLFSSLSIHQCILWGELSHVKNQNYLPFLHFFVHIVHSIISVFDRTIWKNFQHGITNASIRFLTKTNKLQ